jgi:hypothetical protein
MELSQVLCFHFRQLEVIRILSTIHLTLRRRMYCLLLPRRSFPLNEVIPQRRVMDVRQTK